MLVGIKGRDLQKWKDFRQWYIACDPPVAMYNGFELEDPNRGASVLEITEQMVADDYKYTRDAMSPWYYVVDVDDETAIWLAMRFSAIRTRSSVG